MIDDIFTDIIRAQKELEGSLEITRLKESPIYQTGTYSPTYLGSATPGVTTYTTQLGFWTRIGRIVFFNGQLVWTAATGTGNAQVSLPFTTGNVASMIYGFGIYTNGVTFANNNVVIRIVNNSSFFNMFSLLTNAAPTVVAMEAAGELWLTGWFNLS